MFKSVRHSFSFSTLVENIIIFMFPEEHGNEKDGSGKFLEQQCLEF